MALEDQVRQPVVFVEFTPADAQILYHLSVMSVRLESADERERQEITPRFAGYFSMLCEDDHTPAARNSGLAYRNRAYGNMSDVEFKAYARDCRKRFPWRRPIL